MATKIKLVQGDNLPYIKVSLKNADGTALDITSATVTLYFREAGSTTILSTITCTAVGNPTNGIVQFNFPGTTLNVEPGMYEGEIEVNFGGAKQTVYDILKFSVRAQFA